MSDESDDTGLSAAAEQLAEAGGSSARGAAIYGVPIEITVSVGRARPLISDIVSLRRDSILPLDSRIEDPVEIYVGAKLIARGELQELEDEGGRLGVRLTEIMDFVGAS